MSPIGREASPERTRADQVLRHIIVPSVELMGYHAIRADQIEVPGLISTQIVQHLVEDDLVVADLTGHNPNVFYELAIRHLVRKPFIHLIDSKETIPFDVANMRTIHFDATDLDSVEKCKNSIVRHIEEIESDPNATQSPFSVAADLIALRASDDPLKHQEADVLERLSRIEALLEARGTTTFRVDSLTPLTKVSAFSPIITGTPTSPMFTLDTTVPTTLNALGDYTSFTNLTDPDVSTSDEDAEGESKP